MAKPLGYNPMTDPVVGADANGLITKSGRRFGSTAEYDAAVRATQPTLSKVYSIAGTGPAAQMPAATAVPKIAIPAGIVGGPGGPATPAAVAAANAAAANAAAAAAPFVPTPPKKTASKKASPAPTTPTATGSSSSPTVSAPASTGGYNDGTYTWLSGDQWQQAMQQAQASLQGQIDTTKAEYERQLAQMQARQDAAAKLLKDFGISTTQYLSNAAKSAGQGFNTQAAVQALLGAVGQRAFSGSSVPDVARNLAAAGNGQLGQALASQDSGRNAVLGAILNRVVGTDASSQLLGQARTAVQRALGNATANTGYNARLLAGLLNQQQDAYNTLIGQKNAFTAKVPDMISTRASELYDRAYKNMITQIGLGLDQQKFDWQKLYQQGLLTNSEKRIALEAGKANNLTPEQLRKTYKDAADEARILAEGSWTQTQRSDGKTSKTVTRSGAANYQAALVSLTQKVKGLQLQDYIASLNSQPRWSQPGVNGRPYLDVFQRDKLVKAGYSANQVYQAAFDKKVYDGFVSDQHALSVLNGG